MNNYQRSQQESSRHISVWLSILILGLSLIISGSFLMSQTKSIWGGICHGLGISLVTAGLFKIGVNFLENNIYKNWRKNYLEIFSKQRKFASDLYAEEDRKIKNKFQLVSFSAKNAVQQLKNGSYLYKALLKRDSEIELLIVDPSCEDAKIKAKGDMPADALKGMEIIFDCFCDLKELYKNLESKISKDTIFGRFEVRLLEHNPLITIYNRDDNVLIYGPYFPKSRGDEFASIKIVRKHNPEIFDQYKKYFDWCWDRSHDKTLMLFERGKKPFFFNESMFNRISRKVEQELKKGIIN